MPQKQIDDGGLGDIIDAEVTDADELIELRAENRRLRDELEKAKLQASQAVRNAGAALGALRRQLQPLHNALKAVFGEIDASGLTDDAGPAGTGTSGPSLTSVLEEWKKKLPPACGQIIDAIQGHGPQNQYQLKSSAHLGSTSISESTKRMVNLKIIERQADGRYDFRKL